MVVWLLMGPNNQTSSPGESVGPNAANTRGTIRSLTVTWSSTAQCWHGGPKALFRTCFLYPEPHPTAVHTSAPAVWCEPWCWSGPVRNDRVAHRLECNERVPYAGHAGHSPHTGETPCTAVQLSQCSSSMQLRLAACVTPLDQTMKEYMNNTKRPILKVNGERQSTCCMRSKSVQSAPPANRKVRACDCEATALSVPHKGGSLSYCSHLHTPRLFCK